MKTQTTQQNNSCSEKAPGVFDSESKNKKKNDTVTYAINTTDMDDIYYNVLKANSTASTSVKNDATHKANIQEIPLEV
ncbi:hypothetical protein [Fluviicola sp.]|jgi:hypothetical protein|uniref:hypothetical protein n=1 Tax=Fluviicola sp. TaxID=1917219 RepID=UPI00282D238B|nr:hypothetical protein [Fluviicola sp.]MDR0802982.1 hypothetical protein [Fluviicola sp.]